jgi:hypothetical protein
VDFETILQQCLEDLADGRRTLADCLHAYPEQAEALRPLLQISLMTSRLKTPVLSDTHVQTLESRLRKAAAASDDITIVSRPQAKTKSRRLMTWQQTLGRLAAVLLIGMFLALGSGAGLVAASQDTKPGDTLYFIKRIWEAIVLLLSPLTGDLDDLWLQIGQRRLQEVRLLAAENQLTEDSFLDLYGVFYRLSQQQSPDNRGAILAYLREANTTLQQIAPPAPLLAAYNEAYNYTIVTVRSGDIAELPQEVPLGIIPTLRPTLMPPTAAPATVSTALPAATNTLPPTLTSTPLPPSQTAVPSSTASATATALPSSTPTLTPSRTPRIPATLTRTPSPVPSLTARPTQTPTVTATWTPLPLPSGLGTIVPVNTPVGGTGGGGLVTSVPGGTNDPVATRIRETEQAVFLTQTAGPVITVTPTPTETPPE